MKTSVNSFKTAFCLGNGESRKGLDLNELKTKGLLIGCNKIYSEIDPHVICGIDNLMRKEILNQQLTASYIGSCREPYFNKTTQRDSTRFNLEYSYRNGIIDLSEAIKHYPKDVGFNSGVISLIVASYIQNIKTIYMLGFDFHHSGFQHKNNNLYNNQPTIRPEGYANQINSVLSACNPRVNVIIVKKEGDDVFHSQINTSTISYSDFNDLTII